LFRQVCVSLTCREASLDHYAGRQATLSTILGCWGQFSKKSEWQGADVRGELAGAECPR
jgi:hypothetical protein